MVATLIGFTGSASGGEPETAIPPLSLWAASYTVRTGAGGKDNVYLSHVDPVSSPFLSAGGDVMVFRVGAVGPEFTFFASGDVNHYLDPGHTEGTAFAQAKLEQDFGATWKGSLAAEYFFQDQVTDLSGSQTNRQAVAALGHTLSLRPGLRKDLPWQYWLQFETAGTRQWFAEPLDSYWEAAPALTLGRRYGHDSSVALRCQTVWRFYDSEPALGSSGQSLPGEIRRAFQPEVRLSWRHYWDGQKHWRSTLAAGGQFHNENGSGYMDYSGPFASAGILYRVAGWEVSLEGRVAHYTYPNQTASVTDLSDRRRTDWSAGIHLERRVTKHLRLLAGCEHEQTLSNDALETYSANTVNGSVQWEF